MSAQQMAVSSVAQVAEIGLLDQIVEQSKVAKSTTEHARAKDLISELVNQVMPLLAASLSLLHQNYRDQ